jgi:hypothetical protein
MNYWNNENKEIKFASSGFVKHSLLNDINDRSRVGLYHVIDSIVFENVSMDSVFNENAIVLSSKILKTIQQNDTYTKLK